MSTLNRYIGNFRQLLSSAPKTSSRFLGIYAITLNSPYVFEVTFHFITAWGMHFGHISGNGKFRTPSFQETRMGFFTILQICPSQLM